MASVQPARTTANRLRSRDGADSPAMMASSDLTDETTIAGSMAAISRRNIEESTSGSPAVRATTNRTGQPC